MAMLDVALRMPDGKKDWVRGPVAYGPEFFRFVYFRQGLIVELDCLGYPFNASLYLAARRQLGMCDAQR